MFHVSTFLSSMALFAFLAPAPLAFQNPPVNQPPIVWTTYTANFPCQGQTTTIPLDASLVVDPEGDPLTFQWTSGCPGQAIADYQARVTTLSVDTSASCAVDCSVRLRVEDGTNVVFARFFIHISGPILAELDMHPGSCPNPVQIQGCGVVPAALVGTLNFNVANVNRNTLRLARADGQGQSVAPCHISNGDVAVPFPDHGCDCHTLTHDGLPDLVLQFNKHQLVWALLLSHEANKSYLPVVITGKLLTGEDFSAYDCIKVLTH